MFVRALLQRTKEGDKKVAEQFENSRMEEQEKSLENGFLIFAGTSEGRELAAFLAGQKIPAAVCVAPEYGEEILPPMPGIRVLAGRMDQIQMEEQMNEMRPLAVIDATHPYAEAVTENIEQACENTKTKYYRLLRAESELKEEPGIRVFDDCESAAEWLNGQTGNILLTTGMKELPVFAEAVDQKDRIYARVLLQEEVFDRIGQYGLSRKQVICMQGPFSREMNVATIRMTDAAFLVTKESGANGGFSEKAEAARETGAVCVVIRRPVQETGYSAEEIRRLTVRIWKESRLEERNRYRIPEWMNREDRAEAGTAAEGGQELKLTPEEKAAQQKAETAGEPQDADTEAAGMTPAQDADTAASQIEAQIGAEVAAQMAGGLRGWLEEGEQDENPQEPKTITLLGIGMGNPDNMTVEAVRACEQADCIIGAPRMLKSMEAFGCPKIPLTRSEEIGTFLLEHPQNEHVVIAFSGDVGFYSGAKKLLRLIEEEEGLAEYEVRTVCGISSVVYLASRLHMSWEDMALVSVHGREQNLAGAIRRNEKVFTLASDAASIRAIAGKLLSLGLGDVEMYVGVDLSYPTEQVESGTVRDFADFDCAGICAAVFRNPAAGEVFCTHGIPDEEFLRGKVPMTKEEVRSVSLSKLRLRRDSVVYDVGAGTGSISIECALAADQGRVYAIEWKEDAWKLVAENRKKFGAANLEIVPGRAPEVLKELPAPTHAFIGGSSGSLKAILRTLLRKNPQVRVVVNCITLETVQEVLEASKDLELTVEDIASVTVAKSKTVGGHHMMMGQNPVYVMVLWHEQP